MKDKSSLRKYYLELLNKQASEDRQAKSRIIEMKLFEHPAIQKAKTILFYASLPGEVETFAMISKAINLKKNICLPIMVENQRKLIPTLIQKTQDLESGLYGILQPRQDTSLEVSPEAIDAVVLPGLAFDKSHNRLGRGAGYYDRFLCRLSPDTITVGLAFDFQITDRLPVAEHDIPVSAVITN